MSWSLDVPNVKAESFEKELADAQPLPPFSELGDKAKAEISTAKRMLRHSAADMMAFEKHTHLRGRAYGHAEPGHPNRDNYAPDYIGVEVACGCRAAPTSDTAAS